MTHSTHDVTHVPLSDHQINLIRAALVAFNIKAISKTVPGDILLMATNGGASGPLDPLDVQDLIEHFNEL